MLMIVVVLWAWIGGFIYVTTGYEGIHRSAMAAAGTWP